MAVELTTLVEAIVDVGAGGEAVAVDDTVEISVDVVVAELDVGGAGATEGDARDAGTVGGGEGILGGLSSVNPTSSIDESPWLGCC